jgi:putative methionine-R-sulfoxide reductase with GAF domain
MDAHSKSDAVRFPAEDGGKSLADMAQRDLTATLQLLVERAQYITGATGAAIALRDNFEMVCRASSGSSAPGVGTQLQVDSGLSGESVRTRQTLRCDDAWTDERVNRESCEVLGIRSVVVMPLVRDEEVIGVFELFSDQANVFQPRDIAALERMGAMVHTALEVSAAAFGIRPPVPVEQTSFLDQHGLSGELPRFSHPPDDAGTPPAIASQAWAMPERSDAAAVGSIHRIESQPHGSSGIAFHRNIPVTGAAAPAMEPSSVPMPTLVGPPAANEDADVLEMPAEYVIDDTTSAAVDPHEDLLSEMEVRASEPSLATAEQLHASATISMPAAWPQETTPPPIPTPSTVAVPTKALASPAISVPPAIPASPITSQPRGEVASLRRCESCGFPVSDGRKLCLDCEKKAPVIPPQPESTGPIADPIPSTVAASTQPATPVEAPVFLAATDDQSSWLSTHKFMVIAILLALLGILGITLLR